MRFLPQGPGELREMLAAVGAGTPADLFRSIPEPLRLRRPLDLPPAQSELELRRSMGEMAAANASAATHPCFLGAGAYNHYIPSAVWQLLLRSELYTSYTPYQPEISQGTLQATFEYQSMIAALTEMDLSNASLYDGASAAAEAALMALRAGKGRVLVLSEGVHPHYVQVVRAYVKHLGAEVRTVPVAPSGTTDPRSLADAAGAPGTTALIALQSPNFFGCVEDLAAASAVSRAAGALLAGLVTDPIALGLLHGPGRHGADLAAGEAHALGVPLQFGGPYLGFLAARESLVRQMPGRLVGEARDAQGRRGYVLTLSTREQHIRREKATSNICTNQGLMAMAAAVYMSLMGREGMREAASQCRSKALWAAERLSAIPGCRRRFGAPIFHEFVLDLPGDAGEVSAALLRRGIIGGLPLGRHFPAMASSMLFCVTEMNTRHEIEALAAALAEAVR
ncbi:MAG TPA: aminomethyl-transferring glycine dehydrogenase subunit GcvPA [Candidatus Polarisedimenticolia bacterium]|nr:aminomethyl-transferring glycine dehydrogenase subunit GcvPA [Candidatus Polarisedimenticolia bacterium]